jgi:hypothetical protein
MNKEQIRHDKKHNYKEDGERHDLIPFRAIDNSLEVWGAESADEEESGSGMDGMGCFFHHVYTWRGGWGTNGEIETRIGRGISRVRLPV